MKKRLLIVGLLLLLTLIKLFHPPGREWRQRASAFLGLRPETVQTIGRCLDSETGRQIAHSPQY